MDGLKWKTISCTEDDFGRTPILGNLHVKKSESFNLSLFPQLVELDTETSHLLLHSMYTLCRLNPRYRLPRGQHSHTWIPAFVFSLTTALISDSPAPNGLFEDSYHRNTQLRHITEHTRHFNIWRRAKSHPPVAVLMTQAHVIGRSSSTSQE